MQVTVSGASGLIGGALVGALRARGDAVTALSRDPARTQATLGVPAFRRDPERVLRRRRPWPAGTPSCTWRARRSPSAGRGRPNARSGTAACSGRATSSRWSGRLGRRAPGVLVSGSARGLLRSPRARSRSTRTRPRAGLPGPGVRRMGGRSGAREPARAARGEAAHRRRTGSARRRARADAPPVQAGPGGPGRAGGSSTSPGCTSEDLVGLIITILEGPGLVGRRQRDGPRAGHQP